MSTSNSWRLTSKINLSIISGSVALRHLNPTIRRGHKVSSGILEIPHRRIMVGIDTIFICYFFRPGLRIGILFEIEGASAQSNCLLK